jgi:hypothetical protein
MLRLKKSEHYSLGALERQTARTCRQSVTERDETFKRRLREKGKALFDAIVADISLDADNDNDVVQQDKKYVTIKRR